MIDFLNENLPKKLRAKSGFVVFPKERKFNTENPPPDYDFFNKSSYLISRQIDILIYDRFDSSPVFEDENIVLLAPESVRTVIEVKGTLSGKYLNDSIKLLMDYRQKWIEYKIFSKERYVEKELGAPSLFIYAWEFKRDSKGNRLLSGAGIRKKLAEVLRENSTFKEYDEYPYIVSAFVYNECETTFILYGTESVGYFTTRGRSTKFSEEGTLSEKGDKTLFGLLRAILSSNNSLNNRFFYDTDDTNSGFDLHPNKDTGYSKSFNTE